MQSNIYSVSKINSYIKHLFIEDYVLNDIWITGEVSNYKLHSTGHIYFTLKDEASAIACVFFNKYSSQLSFRIEDGMKIITRGYVSIYEKTGQCQLYVQQVKLEGIGELYQRFEELKKSLALKGYFDINRKKEIPKYPNKIGIVTSKTGAAIRDIVNVAKRRNPYVSLLLYSSQVQGFQAINEIVQGINYLDNLEDIDVIIIGRGGGSIEDLWAFNELEVATAIYNAKTPIISAVGHETDFAISDFVADLRAPTPSAAAELAVPSIQAIEETINQIYYRLNNIIINKIEETKYNINKLKLRLKYVNPVYKLEQYQQEIIDLENKLKLLINMQIKEYKYVISIYEEKLKASSPLRNLNKGYAYVEDLSGNIISSVMQVEKEQIINLRLADGKLEVRIINKNEGLIDEE